MICADFVLRHEAGEQPLGGFVGTHQRAGARHLGDEIDQQLFDQAGGDRAQIGHHLGDFLDLFLVHHRPDLGGMLLAQGQHEDGGALGAGERPDIVFDGRVLCVFAMAYTG